MFLTFLRSETNSNAVYQVERTYINTTAFLNYGSYGARQGFVPSAIAQPVAVLDGRRKSISVQI